MYQLKKSPADIINILEKEFGDFCDTIELGAELEFYLHSHMDKGIAFFISDLAKRYNITKEKGNNQYECVFGHSSNILQLIEDIENFKKDISARGLKHKIKVSFQAKPYPQDYGSALHFHFSLHKAGINLFSTLTYDENEQLQYVIGGILHHVNDFLYIICNDDNDYQRFTPNQMAPTTISWGGNNRSTIIRIPDSEPNNRRIEYRLPPASCDVKKAVIVLLYSALKGLIDEIRPPPRTFGLAHDDQYDLEKLLTDKIKALQRYQDI